MYLDINDIATRRSSNKTKRETFSLRDPPRASLTSRFVIHIFTNCCHINSRLSMKAKLVYITGRGLNVKYIHADTSETINKKMYQISTQLQTFNEGLTNYLNKSKWKGLLNAFNNLRFSQLDAVWT